MQNSSVHPAYSQLQTFVINQIMPLYEEAELDLSLTNDELKNKTAASQALAEILQQQFELLLSPLTHHFAQGDMVTAALSRRELSLLSKEEQALQFYSESFSDRASSLCTVPLMLLTMRFEHLVRQTLILDDLPLSPVCIVGQAKAYVLTLELSSERKLLFFKEILKEFVLNYQTLIVEVNNFLIDKGVLTDIDASDGRSREIIQQKKEEARENRKRLMADILGEVEYDDHGKVIPPNMGKVLDKVEIDEEFSEHVLDLSGTGDVLSETDLIKHLDESFDIQGELSDEADAYKERQFETNLAQSLSQNSDISNFTLSKKNSSTIGMMSMLFDDLFSGDFPEAIKALLEQLQIPLLKTALLDKNFFADSDNPAQMLLNLMAEEGINWQPVVEPSKDFVYREMDRIIQKVYRDFDGTYGVFVNALFEFDSFLEKHQVRVKRVQERIIALEKGKARQEQARQASKEHLEKIFDGADVPDDLKNFFFESWSKVLFFTHNKYGSANNNEWKAAIEAEGKILSFLRGSDNADKRDAVYALQAEMLAIGLQKQDVNRELKKAIPHLKAYKWAKQEELNLDQEYLEAIDEGQDSTAKEAMLAFLDSVSDEGDASGSSPTSSVESEGISFESKMTNELSTSSVEGESQACLDDQASTAGDEDDMPALSHENLEKMLTIGTWIYDLHKPEPVKIKVAAYIKHTDSYILVDRSGAKYGSFNSDEMIDFILNGKMTVLETGMVFDRALEKVIKSLKPKEFDMSSM